MARFDYTLPSGDSYILNVPEGTSQTQADIIFYSQVAAGAVVGFKSGDVLTGTSIDSKTFHLSRLQRGTAGVDNQMELAVHSASDVLAGILASINTSNTVPNTMGVAAFGSAPPLDNAALLNIVENLPQVSGSPNLTDTPVTDPIDQADVMNARGADTDLRPVGPLTKFDVQALEAQMANLIKQPYNLITLEKGIGKFGLTCYQLEKANYVKPCTQAMFIEPDYINNFIPTMYSPTIWTGLGGVNSIDDILNDENLQNQIMNDLMIAGYVALVKIGAVIEPPRSAKPKTQSWVYQSGMLAGTSLQQLSDIGQPGGTTTQFGGLISATGTDYGSLVSGAAPNMINNRLNTKQFYYDQVQSVMQTRANMQVGMLVTNAAKYGPEPTVVWSQMANGAGGLKASFAQAQGVMNATTTGLNRMMGLPDMAGFSSTATNPIVSSAISGNFTNGFGASAMSNLPSNFMSQASSGLSMINGNMDLMGKAAQFSMGFSNMGDKVADLTSLSKLSDLASGGFDKISGIATSQLNQLKGLTDGAMNTLSTGFSGISKSFSDLGKVDLGSMADIGKLSGLASNIPGVGGMLSGGLNSLKGLSDQFSGLSGKFDGLMKGDFSKMFGGGDALTSGIKKAVGVTGTFNRQTVDSAVSKVIGSQKIPDPLFTVASAAQSAASTDMSFATDKLSSLGVTGFGSGMSSLGAGSDAASLASKYNSSVPVFSQNQINRVL